MFVMLIINSMLRLLKSSDLLSQLLVYLLVITSFFILVFFLYALISILYKLRVVKKLLYAQQNNNFNELKHNTDHIQIIIQKIICKNGNEEILFYIVDEYIYFENKIKLFFNVSIGIAPLLGLFGTIWGIVNVFLSMQNNFDITSIAPGIAEALITTLGGLIVAIPAVLFYHIINFYIKKYYELVHVYYLYCKEKNEK